MTHAFKGTWTYELPFGQGKRFAGGAGPVLDRVIGGWSFDGIARIQSARMLDFASRSRRASAIAACVQSLSRDRSSYGST